MGGSASFERTTAPAGCTSPAANSTASPRARLYALSIMSDQTSHTARAKDQRMVDHIRRSARLLRANGASWAAFSGARLPGFQQLAGGRLVLARVRYAPGARPLLTLPSRGDVRDSTQRASATRAS